MKRWVINYIKRYLFQDGIMFTSPLSIVSLLFFVLSSYQIFTGILLQFRNKKDVFEVLLSYVGFSTFIIGYSSEGLILPLIHSWNSRIRKCKLCSDCFSMYLLESCFIKHKNIIFQHLNRQILSHEKGNYQKRMTYNSQVTKLLSFRK